MRFLAFWLLACLLLGTPFDSGNVAELSPVEILCLSREDGDIVAACDGGIAARGNDVPSAVAALHTAAPGRLLLGTVDMVVLTAVEPDAAVLRNLGLRPGASLYKAPARVEDADTLAAYLRVHGGGVTLGMLEDVPSLPLPLLKQGETGMVLEQGDTGVHSSPAKR